MGRLKFAPYIFGVAAAFVFAANPADVQAVPVTTANSEISFGDLDIQGKIIYTATEEVASPFYKKGLSTASDCVMIRKEPSLDSEAVGKLYADAGFDVIERVGDWILIRSGSCEGYVYAEYVVTGKEAEVLAAVTDGVYSYGKIIADGVEIKAAAADDADVVATAAADDVIDVIAVIPDTEWTKVLVNGVEGYIKSASVEVSVDYTAALTMEEDAARLAEIEAQIEAERKAEEEAARREEENRETEALETQAPAEDTYVPETQVPETEAPETEAPETEVPETEAPETESEYEEPVYAAPSYSVEDRWETVWATETVNVRSDAGSDASKVGSLSKGSSVTRTGACSNGWSRVEYNGTTAYIHSDYLSTEEPVVEEPSYNAGIGQQIADYAVQFVGNPYVWGGTSLTSGADCSGFVMSIYKAFGYSLPRTCTPQMRAGTDISISSLQPGDLVGYGSYDNLHHIAIYIGNGQIVHASDYSTGTIISSLYYCGTPARATRIAY